VQVSRYLRRAPISTVDFRWDEKAGLRRDAISSQVIDALEAQEIKETDYEEA
jgi:hypothetical protein